MKGLAALSAGGTDQHNVSRRRSISRLRLHLRHRMFDQTKHGVEINREGRPPLLIRHFLDGNIFHGPDSVIRHEDIDSAEVLGRLGNQHARRLRIIQIAADGMTVRRPTFRGQSLRLRPRLLVAEYNLGASRYKKPNRSRANAARTTSDQSNFARERKRNGHA